MNKFITLIFLLILYSSVHAQLPSCDDCDNDGIKDSLEQSLAEKFAPIIIHDFEEQHLPTNVDVFLQQTSLYIYDDDCTPDINKLVKEKPSQQDLITQQFSDKFCNSEGLVKSFCTRSKQKQRTFYLADIDEKLKAGSEDTKKWTTYFHSYKNINDGITIQYWQFYASDISHGGDWESIQIVLDKSSSPIFIDLLGHEEISRKNWSSIKSQDNHPFIYSQKGGHTSIPYDNQQGFKQETWTGGKIYRSINNITETGALLNIGEKLHPLNNQMFIKYSGLWGSPGTFYWSSGYWNPAYNETSMDKNTQFMKAWCNDMLDADKKEENGIKECYPCGTSR